MCLRVTIARSSGIPPRPNNIIQDSSAACSTSEGGLVTCLRYNDGITQNGMDAAVVLNSKTSLPTSPNTKLSGRTPKPPRNPHGRVLTSPKLRKSTVSPLISDSDQSNSVSVDNTHITTTIIEEKTTIGFSKEIEEPSVTVQNASQKSVDTVMAGTDDASAVQAKHEQKIMVGSQRVASNSFSAPEGSQSKDFLMAELKAMKIVSYTCAITTDVVSDRSKQASIIARNAALEAEIADKRAKLEEFTKDLE